MRSDDSDFPFGPNFNFGTNSLFTARNVEQGNPFPIVSGEMDLLDGTHMLLLDGTDMLLL
jgi:hypothetical protein